MKKFVTEKLKNFGSNVKNYRLAKGLSVKELAKLSGLKQAYIYKIERGEAYGLNIDHVYFLAKGLKIKPHELVDGI